MMPTPQTPSPRDARAPRRRRLRHAPAGLAACLALLSPAAPARAAPGSRVPDRYIVIYDADVRDPAAATARRARAQRFRVRRAYRAAIKGFSAVLDERQVARLRDDPAVSAVVADRVVRIDAEVALAAGEPTPPTGVRRVQAATATTVRQPSSARVAVIDTGIKLDHPDLKAVNGTNCVGSGPAVDEQGHGTHVAGTIAARNQGSGVTGVAPGTTVYAVKVLDANGSGSTSSVVCGIDWVASTRSDADPGNDIAVANLSLGGLGPAVAGCAQTRDPMHLAICRATARGVTFTVAAGNDGVAFDTLHQPPSSDPCHSAAGGCPQGVEVPAAYPEVLTVTAISDNDGEPGGLLAGRCYGDDVLASFSNYAATDAGAAHTIAAPGGCIRSTGVNGATATMSGTSMAAPHAAGLAALCLGEAGGSGPCAALAPADVIQRLRADARGRSAQLPSYGFAGDPARPPAAGGYFGYLGWTPRTAAPPPDTAPPAPTLETPANASTTADTTPTFAGTAGAAEGDAGDVTVEVFSGTTTQQLRLTLVAGVVGSTWSITPQTALEAGTYSARVSQRDAAGNVGLSALATFEVTAPQTSAGGPPAPAATAPDPPAAPAGPPSTTIGPPALLPPTELGPAFRLTGRRSPALAVGRARLLVRTRTLDVVASVAAGVTGRVRLAFAAGGRTTRFSAAIRAGRVSVRRRLARGQAARPTGGILTVAYPGDATTRSQQVRLRAAPGSPALTATRPRISADGRLLAGGTVAARARGAVQLQIAYRADERERSFEATTAIRRGRWTIDEPLPAAFRTGLAAREGTPQATVLFSGDRRLGLGGQSRSFAVETAG